MTSAQLAIRNETNLAGLAAFAADNDAVMIAGDPLYFKKGEWFKGEAAFEPKDRAFLANIGEAYTGWVKWLDKKPSEHRLHRMLDYTRETPRSELGDLDKNAWEVSDRGVPQDPWQPSDRLVLRTTDSAEGLLTFISGSKGGRNALSKLMGKVAKSTHAAAGKFPIVQLEGSTYDHDDYGLVHYPVFKIVDWAFWDSEKVDQKDDPRTGFDKELNDAIPF